MDTDSGTTIPVESEPTKNYIRTFASDMAVFQKGGMPGLIPLEKTPVESTQDAPPPPPPVPPPSEPLVAETAKQPEPILLPPEEPTTIELPEKLLEEAPAPIPEPEPISEPEPILAPEPLKVEKIEEEKPTPLETYAQDFRDRMKKTEASTVTVLAEQQDAAPYIAPSPEKNEKSKYSVVFIIFGILLLGAGGTGVYVAYSHYQVVTAPVIPVSTAPVPIVIDERTTVSGTGATLMQAVNQSVAAPLLPNTIRLLSLDTSSGASVFSALALPAPDILLRNIHSTGSMAGVINTGDTQSPFFILSVDAYDATFSGMLSWEPTMQKDLGNLFPLYSLPGTGIASATSTATSTVSSVATTTSAAVSGQKAFRDEVVSNHDVRIYRDVQGRSILLYGYWNQNLLIIARDPVAFTEILGRLASYR